MIKELVIQNNKSTCKEYKNKNKDVKVKVQTPEEQKAEQLKVNTLSSLFKTKKESFDRQVEKLVDKSFGLENKEEFNSLVESIKRAKNADYAVKLFKEARQLVRNIKEEKLTESRFSYYAVDKDGNRLNKGDEITSFRGETYYYYGTYHPRKVTATENKGDDFGREYYPGVFDLEIREETTEEVVKEEKLEEGSIPKDATEIEVKFSDKNPASLAGKTKILKKNENGDWSDGSSWFVLPHLRDSEYCTIKVLKQGKIEENFEDEHVGSSTNSYTIYVQNKANTTGTDFSVFDKSEIESAINAAADEIKKIAKQYEDKGFDIDLTIKGVE